MRGIFVFFINFGFSNRFTPAYAGNIWRAASHNSRYQVHPRVCGEYFHFHCCSSLIVGSPPRMRGIFRLFIIDLAWLRFTPAYAGNILLESSRWRIHKVHPRVCGEYVSLSTSIYYILGSPPRMRGIWKPLQHTTSYFRFTPAYAGNIIKMNIKTASIKVHPRVCGEYLATRKLYIFQSGSPPRMRGISRLLATVLAASRFTPAYAGNMSAYLNFECKV